MLTGKQLANYCEKVYRAGWVYWYGTYGKPCSQSLYEGKRKQYPSHYTDARTSGYMKDIREGKWCADCVGMIKSFFWTGGNFQTMPKYATNHCPDTSANGMIKLCPQTGPISTIPDIPGLVVWKSGHIGVYVGNGYTVEMKGFNYDCKRNRVKDGPWTKWGRLPASMISYTNEPMPEPTPEPVKLGDRVLKYGDEGEDVRELQTDLMKLGYDLPVYGADGDFGSETERAVRRFQREHELPEDGVMDDEDYSALFAALDVVRYVEITGGSVNVRKGPGVTYEDIGTVHRGDRLPYQGETQNTDGRDWYLVEYQNQNGWVSSKYARLVGV